MNAAPSFVPRHEPLPINAMDRPARVLLAEDNLRVRQAIGIWLRHSAFETIEAEDGPSALRVAAESSPDVALIDIGLPHVDGLRVIEQLRASRTDLSIIAMSGLSDLGVRVQAFDAGADDFLPKPLHMPGVLKRLDVFRRTQKALAHEQQAREQAERVRLYAAEAAALIAHDLNNGLATAMCNLDLVSEAVDQVADVEALEMLRSTMHALKRMAGLTKNFVDVGRLEDHALRARPEAIELRALLAMAADIHEPAVYAKRVRMEVDCPSDLCASLDPVLTERLLHNLVGNATRYVNSGGLIRLRAHRGRAGVEIEVGNTGPELAPHMRPLLFEKYRTGGDGKALRGMGLYFCRLACEAHGGSIELVADCDLDVCFRVRFPDA